METRQRLHRLALANSILGYIAVFLAVIVAVLFAVSLSQIEPGKILPAFLLIVYVSLLVSGLLSSIILAMFVIGIVEMCLAQRLGTLGQVKPKFVIAAIVTADVISFFGIIAGIAIEAIEYTTEGGFEPHLWACIGIVLFGCLLQAIFNSFYSIRIKGPRTKQVKKSH